MNSELSFYLGNSVCGQKTSFMMCCSVSFIQFNLAFLFMKLFINRSTRGLSLRTSAAVGMVMLPTGMRKSSLKLFFPKGSLPTNHWAWNEANCEKFTEVCKLNI